MSTATSFKFFSISDTSNCIRAILAGPGIQSSLVFCGTGLIPVFRFGPRISASVDLPVVIRVIIFRIPAGVRSDVTNGLISQPKSTTILLSWLVDRQKSNDVNGQKAKTLDNGTTRSYTDLTSTEVETPICLGTWSSHCIISFKYRVEKP